MVDLHARLATEAARLQQLLAENLLARLRAEHVHTVATRRRLQLAAERHVLERAVAGRRRRS